MVRPFLPYAEARGGHDVTQIKEQALSAWMAALMRGESTGDAPWPDDEPIHAWRLIRWESDIPLTDEQRAALLASAEKCMRPLCVSSGCFSFGGDELTILLCATRYPARVHRETVLWLCAHELMEQASVTLETEGTMFIGEEFAQAADWQSHLAPMQEISDWWAGVSPLDGAAAHRHRTNLQTSIKRRQYTVLGGYVSRALRDEAEPGPVCFAFIPLVIEAVWSRHAELSLQKLTEELNLQEMTRRPKEALMAWLSSLPPRLRACPAPAGSAPIERVIASIRADCSLPYSQANLSHSLGLTPAYFCRLFREKTGQHFSSFLTRTRMEKAQELLAMPGTQTLADVSAACGYPNKSYFCQVFKKYTGMTPGEYEASAKLLASGILNIQNEADG